MSYICGLEGKWPDVHVMQIAAVGTCDDKRQTICLNLGMNLFKKCNNALYKNIFAGETQHLGESNTKKFVHLIMNYYDY